MKKIDLDRILICIDYAWNHTEPLEDIKKSVESILKVKKNKIIQEHDHPLLKYILSNYPAVSQLSLPSYKECEFIKNTFNRLLIIEKLEAMENKKTLLKDYKSLFLTLKNWCTIAIKNGWQPIAENKPTGANLKMYE